MKYFYVHLLICLPKIFAQRKKRTHLSGYSGQQCSSPKQGKNKFQKIFVLWTTFFNNKKLFSKKKRLALQNVWMRWLHVKKVKKMMKKFIKSRRTFLNLKGNKKNNKFKSFLQVISEVDLFTFNVTLFDYRMFGKAFLYSCL